MRRWIARLDRSIGEVILRGSAHRGTMTGSMRTRDENKEGYAIEARVLWRGVNRGEFHITRVGKRQLAYTGWLKRIYMHCASTE